MKEITEFYCHECDGYVKVELDYALNGNHVVECPNCGHEHCRVIQDGKITGDRWDSRNQNSYNYGTSTASWSATSMYTSSSASASASSSSYAQYAITSSWVNTTGTGSWS